MINSLKTCLHFQQESSQSSAISSQIRIFWSKRICRTYFFCHSSWYQTEKITFTIYFKTKFKLTDWELLKEKDRDKSVAEAGKLPDDLFCFSISSNLEWNRINLLWSIHYRIIQIFKIALYCTLACCVFFIFRKLGVVNKVSRYYSTILWEITFLFSPILD